MNDQTYNGFTGCDIELYHGERKLCELQAISFQQTREMAPIYTMGNRPLRKSTAIAGTVLFKEGQGMCVPREGCEIKLTARNEHGEESRMSLQGIEFLDKRASTFVASALVPWSTSQLECECGAAACNSPGHSDWCPLG